MERGIRHCAERDFRELADIWERSVRASHSFLGEEDIAEIRAALVPHYFPAVELYGLEENGSLVGFVGLAGSNVEMLFVDGCERGHGIGSRLMAHVLALGAESVDVNEQNPSALKFYLSKGFEIVGRDECDPAGRPFPILHLRLRNQSNQTKAK